MNSLSLNSHVDRSIAFTTVSLLLMWCYLSSSRLLNWDCSCSAASRSSGITKTGSRACLRSSPRWVIHVGIHAVANGVTRHVLFLVKTSTLWLWWCRIGCTIRSPSRKHSNETDGDQTPSQLLKITAYEYIPGLGKVVFCITLVNDSKLLNVFHLLQ